MFRVDIPFPHASNPLHSENEFEKEINLNITGSPASLFSSFLVSRIVETSRETVTH